MVEIQIAYQGELRCQAKHVPSGTMMVTDAPIDNMGKGESFSPTDLVAVALGTCMLTTMGIAARRHEIDLKGATVKVLKEMITSPLRRIGRLPVEIHVPVALSQEHRQRLENAALTCPVHKGLHPDIEAPVTFHWGK